MIPPYALEVDRTLRIMRVTWAVLLLVCLAYFAFPLSWGLAVVHEGWPRDRWVSVLGPSGFWCQGYPIPGTRYLVAALLVLAAAILPAVLHRRSIARLRRRAVGELDPSRAGDYRRAPGTRPRLEHPGPALRSAAARYAARLSLSFALVAPLPLLVWLEMGQMVPFTSCVSVVHCYVEPALYAPFLLAAVVVIAVQFPARRRALRAIEDLCV